MHTIIPFALTPEANHRSWFEGRNGCFNSKALDVLQTDNGSLIIQPITTKDQIARCAIALPNDALVLRKVADALTHAAKVIEGKGCA
jgi:hypothetical protein